MFDDATTLVLLLLVVGSFSYAFIGLARLLLKMGKSGWKMFSRGLLCFGASSAVFIFWMVTFAVENNIHP